MTFSPSIQRAQLTTSCEVTPVGLSTSNKPQCFAFALRPTSALFVGLGPRLAGRVLVLARRVGGSVGGELDEKLLHPDPACHRLVPLEVKLGQAPHLHAISQQMTNATGRSRECFA